MPDNWTTIESDPGVFTELIQQIGVKGVQVEELYSLDKECLDSLKPVHGLIFLFKWTPERDTRDPDHESIGRVFFAKQVITNACATQAILSILMNAKADIGPILSDFKEFTSEFPPELKGEAISNSDIIREAHNSFARPEPIVHDESAPAGKDDDAFHFIGYVPVEGTLYELDGLKEGPFALCSCTEENWLDEVRPVIQARIDKYSQSEIRFNLMAIVGDRKDMMSKALAEHIASRDKLQSSLLVQSMDDEAMSVDQVQCKLAELEHSITSLQDELSHEEAKRKRWHEENIRRRHNYIPFLFNLLKVMAEQGKLQPIIDHPPTTSS